ncbi:MAG TPA: mercuric reductase [Myxococcota bacterium]|nr:mercuric reductase [Myxococcota bacterium]
MREIPQVLPQDAHNRTLTENVHPATYRNPTPAPRYNLVVIGAGTAGLVTAAGAAGLGARVALVEKNLMGGDCLNVGCVPSKAVIRSSRAAAEVKGAGAFGVDVPPGTQIDFAKAMERMRAIRARISHHDSVERFTKELGVDVFLGEGRFTGADAVEVDGAHLKYRRAVITTGARAAEPPVSGLSEAGFLTNETVFSLVSRPRRLAVIGGGPIGSELAQAFQRLGCEVTLFHDRVHLLEREDPDAAAIVQRALLRDGVSLVLNAAIERVERKGEKGEEKVLRYRVGSGLSDCVVDEILVGAGRQPNVEGLELERVGVAYDPKGGIRVDDRLRTTNPTIFAAGDVCMAWKFTHAADFAARIVIQNALFPSFSGGRKLSALHMPWCTYTEPEIAHVGLYEHEAAARGIGITTFLRPFSEVDRALCDGEEDGFVKIHIRKGGSDQILGATIVAQHAGDMISEVSVAMAGKLGLSRLANVIHPYPTQAEAIRQIGDLYNRTRLTPLVKALFQHWLRFTR